MIDWEDIIRAESVEELKTAKLWLFQENMRLENEKKELEKERREIASSQGELKRERDKLQVEMNDMNRYIDMERKRLKDENLFFDKKLEILQDGFRHLEEDRKVLEREKRALSEERKLLTDRGTSTGGSNVGELLFRSASNPLGLRKRYRDLVKIFHPDNLFGDEELAQLINREFQRRKKEE